MFTAFFFFFLSLSWSRVFLRRAALLPPSVQGKRKMTKIEQHFVHSHTISHIVFFCFCFLKEKKNGTFTHRDMAEESLLKSSIGLVPWLVVSFLHDKTVT